MCHESRECDLSTARRPTSRLVSSYSQRQSDYVAGATLFYCSNGEPVRGARSRKSPGPAVHVASGWEVGGNGSDLGDVWGNHPTDTVIMQLSSVVTGGRTHTLLAMRHKASHDTGSQCYVKLQDNEDSCTIVSAASPFVCVLSSAQLGLYVPSPGFYVCETNFCFSSQETFIFVRSICFH